MKQEARGIQSAGGQGGDHRRGTGHRHHAQAGGPHRLRQAGTGVGNARRAGVRDLHHDLALLQPADHAGRHFALIVFAQADQFLADAVGGQQTAGDAGIFRQNNVRGVEPGNGAQCHISQIPNRRGQHI
ncbi:hypothetical protein D3C84_1017830 [compost metagenome]